MHHFEICQKYKTHVLNIYISKFDAHCCPLCNEWTERNCQDPSCTYCKTRPTKPFTNMAHEKLLQLFELRKGNVTSPIPPTSHLHESFENYILQKFHPASF